MPRSILDPVRQAYDVAARQAYARRTAAIIHEALNPVDNRVPAEVARLERMSREQEHFFSQVQFEYAMYDYGDRGKRLVVKGRWGRFKCENTTFFTVYEAASPDFDFMVDCAKQSGENEARQFLWRRYKQTAPLTASEILSRPVLGVEAEARLRSALDETLRPLSDVLKRTCEQVLENQEDWCKGEWFVNEKTGGVQVRRGK